MGASEEQVHQAQTTAPASDQNPALPYRVTVKPGDQHQGASWIASVDELEGCVAGGSTPDEAVENLRVAMESWLSAAAEDPRVIKPPKRSAKQKKASSHSGRFLVRMPSTLHEELTRAAEREEVSLNRFVTAQLAASVGPAETAGPAESEVPAQAQAPVSPQPQKRGLRVLLAANVFIMVIAAVAAAALLILALERGV